MLAQQLEPDAAIGPLEPVAIRHERRCHFKKKPADPATGKKRLGCERCGRAKNDPDHLGAPESFNVFASSTWSVYQAAKQRWAKVLTPLLEESGLPRGLDRIVVEAEATFPDRTRRDQGNFRVILEKALGDVLVEGGWLPDDKWDRYEFGNLTYRYEKGVSATQVVLFPSLAAPAAPDGPPALFAPDALGAASA